MRKRKTYENYYTVEQVADMTENSVSFAYKLIQKLNKELEAAGKLTFRGRVHKDFFHEKFYDSGHSA